MHCESACALLTHVHKLLMITQFVDLSAKRTNGGFFDTHAVACGLQQSQDNGRRVITCGGEATHPWMQVAARLWRGRELVSCGWYC